MKQIAFTKKVSKGSRFNQIYVPKEMNELVEVGDTVEVRLVKKSVELFYSKELKEVSKFKEEIIRDVFSIATTFFSMKKVFIVGSFLTENVYYNDVDLVVVVKRKEKGLEEKLYNRLIEKINLPFHILLLPEDRFQYLLKSCPLTRVMFSCFVSDNQTRLPLKKIIDKNHIKFLLMMPEDLLEMDLGSRVFYDNLRRLITIEMFLKNKETDIREINKELKKLIGERLFYRIENYDEVEKKDLRKIIKDKLRTIRGLLDGKEG